MKLPSYRMVEDIPAPEGVVTPEGDRIMMVDLASASLRESALREHIRGLEKHNELLDTRVGYWYKRYSEVMGRHEKLESENAELRRVQEDLIRRAVDRLLNETT